MIHGYKQTRARVNTVHMLGRDELTIAVVRCLIGIVSMPYVRHLILKT